MRYEPVDAVDSKFGVHGGGAAVVAKGVGGGDDDVDDAAAVVVVEKIMPHDRRQRRLLSEALPDGGCEVTWPKPPRGRIQTAYAASYPGE